jgi:hypothetical protein
MDSELFGTTSRAGSARFRQPTRREQDNTFSESVTFDASSLYLVVAGGTFDHSPPHAQSDAYQHAVQHAVQSLLPNIRVKSVTSEIGKPLHSATGLPWTKVQC